MHRVPMYGAGPHAAYATPSPPVTTFVNPSPPVTTCAGSLPAVGMVGNILSEQEIERLEKELEMRKVQLEIDELQFELEKAQHEYCMFQAQGLSHPVAPTSVSS